MNHTVGAVQVAGHDACGETEVGVVGTAHHFIFAVVTEDAHHRAEDFFTHDGHVVGAVGEHGRRNERALVEHTAGQALAAAQQTCALLFALGDIAQHAFHVLEADQRAEIDVLVFRVAGANALHTLKDLRFELGLQAVRHEHAGAVGADLTGAVEVGHHRDVGGTVEIGVVKHDQR